MSNDNRIFFLGYSGHAFVAMEVALANGLVISGYFENKEKSFNPFNLHYCGDEKDKDFCDIVKHAAVFPGVGSNTLRQKMHQYLCENKILQTVLKHPSATISQSAEIGESTLVNPNAVVNCLAKIGNACIINSAAVIEHEAAIGSYTHIAPGAIIAGNVHIGQGCFIGAGAVIKQGVTIADGVTIGAGAVVLKNIEQKGTWVGNPANQILRNEK